MSPRSRDDQYARLPTERALAASADLDGMSALAIVRLMARQERESARAVERAAVEAATAALASGGRLVYAGAGTSGRLAALDAAELPPTFGIRPAQAIAILAGGPRAMLRSVEGAEDDEAAAVRALRKVGVGNRDVVIGVAASGVTPFVRAALATARTRGATTVLVTCAAEAAARAGMRADHVVGLRIGPEVLSGSTRLKAGTATKMALNALSTATMVGLGKCYGARMVDVVASNAKLRARAARMVADFTGRPGADAEALLRAAGGRAKVAIAMARLGVSRAEAERRLARVDGRLRDLLGPARAPRRRRPRVAAR
jgi:N-acetylmuramic acid 6-phosphate etherase